MKYIFLSVFLLTGALGVKAQEELLLVHSGKAIAEGVKYHDQGKYDKAIFKYNQVNESDTNYATALYELIISYNAQENYNKAIQCGLKGISLKSGNRALFYQQLGNAYSGNKQLDEAIQTYRKGLKEFPYYFRFYFEMGAAYYVAKDYKSAMLYLDSCLQINFSYPRAHYLMGMVCQDNNYFVPALLSFQMAAYLGYDDAVGFNALSAIQKIADGQTRLKSKDSVVVLFGKNENKFEDLQEIIVSQGELTEKYKVKPKVKLPYLTVIRCMHLVNSRLKNYNEGNTWYQKNLIPIYQRWWDRGDFATLMYRVCNSTESEEAVKMYNKNKDKIKKQYNLFINEELMPRETYPSRMPGLTGTFRHLFLHSNHNLTLMMPTDAVFDLERGFIKSNGYYRYFYSNGFMEKEGSFQTDQEFGPWKYYNEEGIISSFADYHTKGSYEFINYYNNGNPKNSGSMVNGKNTGVLKLYYSNGAIEKEIPVNSAEKIHGMVKVYHENGQLEYETQFSNGDLADGQRIVYSKHGNKINEYLISGGKRNKAETTWYESGKIFESGSWSEGEKEGKWTHRYEGGQIKSEEMYQSGKLNGQQFYYHENGKLESEYTYVRGDQKISKLYDKDGKIYAEYTGKKGRYTKVVYFAKDGTALFTWEAGADAGPLKKYSENGILLEEGEVKNDYRTGPWHFYYNSGGLNYNQDFDSYGKGTGKVETFYTGGKIKSTYRMMNGDAEGYYQGFSISGDKKSEGFYVSDQKEGVWKEYYNNGNVSEENYYLNGNPDGHKKTFYPNGKLHFDEYVQLGRFEKLSLFDTAGMLLDADTIGYPNGSLALDYAPGKPYARCNYIYGMKEGVQTFYYMNGHKMTESTFHLDDIIGAQNRYYASGALRSVQYYRFGQKDSLFLKYYETGALEYKKEMRDGEDHGQEIYYYETGKIEIKGQLEKDQREGWFEYYAPDGSLQYKTYYHNGVLLSYVGPGKDEAPTQVKNASCTFSCHFANGNISATGVYVNGTRNGNYVRYYPNGKKSEESTYLYGHLEGKVIEYYENGNIKRECSFKNDNKEGTEKLYDEKGNLIKEMQWTEDEQNGPEIHYKNGKAIKTIHFQFDNTNEK